MKISSYCSFKNSQKQKTPGGKKQIREYVNNKNNLIKLVPFFLIIDLPLNYLKGMERLLNESTTVEK
jgi:hypothetical protein